MGLLLDRLKQIELGTAGSLAYDDDETLFTTPEAAASPTLTRSRADSGSGSGSSMKKKRHITSRESSCKKFPDLSEMPPELSLHILRYLNATDLCLAACVWSSLANDDILWHGLCKSEWGYASIYDDKMGSRRVAASRVVALAGDEPSHTLSHQPSTTTSSSSSLVPRKTYRRIFMQLDEATLTFNADWKKGLEYLLKENLLEDDPMEIAKFINSTKKLNGEQKEKLFKENKAVLENVIYLHNYANQFLPTALRRFFAKIEAPRERNSYLSFLLEKFSKRFCSCNPDLGLSEDTVYILCFSLILLSVDLTSPAVKNKMSKREFIKNTRNALPHLNPDFTGHLYDNIYLNGSIASNVVTVR